MQTNSQQRHWRRHNATLEVAALPKWSNMTVIKPINLRTNLQNYEEQRDVLRDALANAPREDGKRKTPWHWARSPLALKACFGHWPSSSPSIQNSAGHPLPRTPPAQFRRELQRGSTVSTRPRAARVTHAPDPQNWTLTLLETPRPQWCRTFLLSPSPSSPALVSFPLSLLVFFFSPLFLLVGG